MKITKIILKPEVLCSVAFVLIFSFAFGCSKKVTLKNPGNNSGSFENDSLKTALSAVWKNDLVKSN